MSTDPFQGKIGKSQKIEKNDLQCNGTEASILDCRSNGLFQHNCGHKEDAGVACQGIGFNSC